MKMAKKSVLAFFFGPSSVTIHYDGDVAWQPVFIDLFKQGLHIGIQV
jgi:hypothetical protein